MRKKMSKASRGFTLIELVAVVAIIGILAAFAIPAYINMATTARDNAARAALGTIRSAVAISYANSALGGGTPTFPTLTGALFTTNTVPPEPYNNVSTVTTTTQNPITTVVSPPANGYLYNQTTGEVRINTASAIGF